MLGGIEQGIDPFDPAAENGQARLGQAEPRAGADQLGGQRRQPPLQGRAFAVYQQAVGMLLDQARRPGLVGGGQGVAHGVIDQPMRFGPAGGVAVQLVHPLWPLALEAGAQQVGEQLVVAPPAADLIQGHQEQVGPLDLFQHRLAVVAAGDRVTQSAAQPLQHRGLEQELAHRLRLAFEHLLAQEVENVPVAAVERRRTLTGVGSARLASTRHSPRGRCSTRNPSEARTGWASIRW